MDHTDREYHHHLEEIRRRILRMASLVEWMISNAITSLTEGDLELAKKVIAKDRVVDQLELDIDELGGDTLARWQPMATDLRFIILSFKMVTDLERIGDLAVNICERAPDFVRTAAPWTWGDLEDMGQLACDMLRDAIDAFLKEDAAKAQAVIDRDDLMDRTYEKAFNMIYSSIQPSDLHLGIHGLSIAKWLERIGDHVTNLAEQVIFMLQGKDVRHAPRDRDADVPEAASR